MSSARIFLIGTGIGIGIYKSLRPEVKQKLKSAVGKQLRLLGNALDPQGPPPMWTDKEEPDTTEPAAQDESVEPAEEPEEEDRTIHGFKVKH